MTEITVRYHHEGDTWWAESGDLHGFSAAGASLPEVREQVREGLAFHLEVDHVDLLEVMADGDGIVASVTLLATMPSEFYWQWQARPSQTSAGPGDYQIKPSASPSPTLQSRLIA